MYLAEAGVAIYNYWIYVLIMMIGFYGTISRTNLVKKVISLSLFQTAVFLFYISMGVRENGVAPILLEGDEIYNNPLPHVLILTAIVVSVSISAVALAIVIRIQEAYGTVEAQEIAEMDREDDQ